MINQKSSRYLFVFILILGSGIIFLRNHRKTERAGEDSLVQVQTIRSRDGGWGYDIMKKGKRYIHQEYIPAIPGQHGFRSEADALKVGREVASRINSNLVPTITLGELKSWAIIDDSLALK